MVSGEQIDVRITHAGTNVVVGPKSEHFASEGPATSMTTITDLSRSTH